MKTWLAIVLSLFLIVSLGINVYLWLSLKQHNDKAYALEASYEHRLDSDKQLETQVQLVDETQVNEKAEPFNNERSPANFSPMTGANTAPNELDDLRTSSPLVNQGQLDSLTTLLNNEQYALLASELTNLLKYDPLNESLLLLEGELIELTKPLSTAIVHYYDLAELPLSSETLSFIDARIATLYQQAQTQLSQDEQWELVARLNEPLYQRIPDARHYTLNLAEAYAYQQKLTLMEDVLAALPLNDRDANIIRNKAYEMRDVANADNTLGESEPAPSEAEAARYQTRVALQRIGDQYRLEAKALNQKATMILDTGASTTAISSRLFVRLGRMRNLTFIGNFNVRTASGTIEAPLVQIPRFYFAGYEFNDVSAIVLPEDALPDADGLLGMNVLGQFDFAIMPQSSELILTERDN
ncbi:peptidase A2A, retrovirus, catalytic [Alteromonas macleodii str. 'Balearic Sea AD45']|uniref:retropepsin-like aspartic protease family protein n=1 Tax=Alteromonas macleodii TaxID=28108 RepID=UPI000286CBA0|nr:retropepsin-like aspartic protease [Alteromonas macleodii]AFT95947.1 peptidase A2A, retrovirus, catalytic [Alteromonas macleodii str. 'Balearic Sea AD45']